MIIIAGLILAFVLILIFSNRGDAPVPLAPVPDERLRHAHALALRVLRGGGDRRRQHAASQCHDPRRRQG